MDDRQKEVIGRRYEVQVASNGYIVTQSGIGEQGSDASPYGTTWIFSTYDEAVSFLASRFFALPSADTQEMRVIREILS